MTDSWRLLINICFISGFDLFCHDCSWRYSTVFCLWGIILTYVFCGWKVTIYWQNSYLLTRYIHQIAGLLHKTVSNYNWYHLSMVWYDHSFHSSFGTLYFNWNRGSTINTYCNFCRSAIKPHSLLSAVPLVAPQPESA